MIGANRSYKSSTKTVEIPIEDAERIKYLLWRMLRYIDDVGPRDLRDHKDELSYFIKKLPEMSD